MRILLMLSLIATAVAAEPVVVREVTRKAYQAGIADNAVVVFDVNWGRRWNCGGYENAELMRIEFDRITGESKAPGAKADFVVTGPWRLIRERRFLNYAFILPPGTYALSGFSIKVASSITEVGYLNANRSELIKNGVPEGGTFTVAAGEIVFIGNFFLDCQTGPILWRYYTEGENFQNHVAEFMAKYPFLEAARFQYRLFRSEHFGIDYELPE